MALVRRLFLLKIDLKGILSVLNKFSVTLTCLLRRRTTRLGHALCVITSCYAILYLNFVTYRCLGCHPISITNLHGQAVEIFLISTTPPISVQKPCLSQRKTGKQQGQPSEKEPSLFSTTIASATWSLWFGRRMSKVKAQAYHPLFVWSTVLFNGRYGYEFWIAFLYDAIFRAF